LFNIEIYRKYVFIPISLFVAFQIFNLAELTKNHDPKNHFANVYNDWSICKENNEINRNIKKYLPNDIKIILNSRESVKTMFYNNDLDVYDRFLTPEEFEYIKRNNLKIAFFPQTIPGRPIPEYVANYPGSFKIPDQIQYKSPLK
jgi:hypothetical protein